MRGIRLVDLQDLLTASTALGEGLVIPQSAIAQLHDLVKEMQGPEAGYLWCHRTR